MMPAAIWLILVQYPNHLFESLFAVCMFSVCFGLPAITIGWVLHCLVVMARRGIRRGGEHPAQPPERSELRDDT